MSRPLHRPPSLRGLLLAVLLLATAVLTAGSLYIGLRGDDARAWADARGNAQAELSRLVVVAERMALSDPSLIEELVALTLTDERVAHAVVIDPDGRVLASTVSAEQGQWAASLPGLDTAALAALRNGGQARVVRTLVDAPFYSRSEIRTRLLGREATAVHESLSLDRFASPAMYAMLPFRVPRPFS